VDTILVADGSFEQRQGDGTVEGLDVLADDEIVVFVFFGVAVGGEPGCWGGLILVLDVPDSSFKVEVFCNVAVLFGGRLSSIGGISFFDSIDVDFVEDVLSLE
jgi:hypothetical protein